MNYFSRERVKHYINFGIQEKRKRKYKYENIPDNFK